MSQVIVIVPPFTICLTQTSVRHLIPSVLVTAHLVILARHLWLENVQPLTSTNHRPAGNPVENGTSKQGRTKTAKHRR